MKITRPICLILCAFFIVIPGLVRGQGNNISPYCTKVYVNDSTELSLYTSTMFRIRVSNLSEEKFPPKYEIPFVIGKIEPWPDVDFSQKQENTYEYVRTDDLLIRMNTSTGEWRVFSADGNSQIYPSDGPVYGMFRDGYTVFDNASAFNEYNKNSRFSHYFYNHETGRYIDTYLEEDLIEDNYFIYGPEYEKLYAQFNELVGPEPLLPKKAYGFFQTQHLACYGTQEKLMETAHMLRERDIPCDNLIIDFEWGDGCDGKKELKWGSGMGWSSSYFSPLTPVQMLDSLHAMNYNVMLIHHNAPDFKNRKHQGWTETVWQEEEWWDNFFALLDQGVDGTWQDTRRNDITDSYIWQRMQDYFGLERRVLFLGCRKMQALNPWDNYYTAAPMNQIIGSRRYPFDWTGDCSYSWNEFAWQIKALTNTHGSMKGVTYVTSDAVGINWKVQARWHQFAALSAIYRSHNPKPWTGDIDFIDFVNKIRITGRDTVKIKDDELNPIIEDKPTAEESIKKHAKLRYRLLPYIYSYAFVNYLSGMPICRPMLLAFSDNHHCNGDQWPYQYMFGDWLLVAPVFGDFNTMEIYLPAGYNWIDYWSNEIYKGGGVLRYDVTDINKLPIFVKEGAILPMREDKNWIEPNEFDNPMILSIYPTEASEFTLYEDDGTSTRYQEGKYATTQINVTRQNADIIKTMISAMNGEFTGKPTKRKYHCTYEGISVSPAEILVNGKKLARADTQSDLDSHKSAWFYDMQDHCIFVNFQATTFEETNVQIIL